MAALVASLRLPAEPQLLELVLRAFVVINQRLLQLCPSVPPLYRSGVRYQLDRQWYLLPTALLRRRGDCKHLVPWRLAELHQAGETDADLRICWMGRTMMHVYILRADGSIEDPSVVLGMKPPPRSLYT